MSFELTTGCNVKLSLNSITNGCFDPVEPIDAAHCCTRTLREAKTLKEVFALCKVCPFGRKDARIPVPPPSAVEPEPAGAGAGIIPVNTVTSLEPIITPDEILNSSAPPSTPPTAPLEDLPPAAPAVNPPAAEPPAGVQTDPEQFAAFFNSAAPLGAAEPPPAVGALVKEACPWHVDGGSLLGWSKLRLAKICLRYFYWEIVMGLRRKPAPPTVAQDSPDEAPKQRISALELGSLVHVCLETMYRTGSIDEMWKPVNAIKDYYPELALETRRLVNFYLRKFNETETKTWDLRAVERESRYYFPPRKIAGKNRSLCISCRHDGIYRKIKPGQKRLPAGAVAESICIHELKTTATLTGNRLRAFYQDAQVMTNLLCYNHGHAVKRDGTVLAPSSAALIGPAHTVTVTFIGKAKRMDINRDIERVEEYVIPEERVLSFRDDLQDWFYEEIAARLFGNVCDVPETWRKDWACKDVFYSGWICPYVELCQTPNVDWGVIYDQRERLDPTALELPKALAKTGNSTRRVKTAAVVEAK